MPSLRLSSDKPGRGLPVRRGMDPAWDDGAVTTDGSRAELTATFESLARASQVGKLVAYNHTASELISPPCRRDIISAATQSQYEAALHRKAGEPRGSRPLMPGHDPLRFVIDLSSSSPADPGTCACCSEQVHRRPVACPTCRSWRRVSKQRLERTIGSSYHGNCKGEALSRL